MVAPTYSERLADEQLENVSALNRDYSEQLQAISIHGKLAEQRVSTYADTLLTAMNSRPRFVADFVTVPDHHPCTKNKLEFLDNPDSLDADSLELPDCCQRHICRPDGYCKSKKGNGCRFDYPIQLQSGTTINFEEFGSSVRAKIALRRNESWLNMHNRVMHQHWRTKVDLQLILDRHAVVAYMVKYASKGE